MLYVASQQHSIFLENIAPTRRSDRSTKGQGGALERLQASSDAIHGPGIKKPKKAQVPDGVAINPMAPVPKKRTRRQVDVSFISFLGYFGH
jgi:hypothetical protein